MSQSAIYDLFADRVADFAAQLSPALPVAYPGVPFIPPASGRWLEVRWFPNETQTYAMQDTSPAVVLSGIGQVTVCERPGAGIVEGQEIAAEVVDYFAKGTSFGVARVERQPWVSSVLQEPDRTMYPVTIRWRGVNQQ
jgi:hypothetical protein